MSGHPTNPTGGIPTAEELAAWPNCSVPDCEAKVTHGSDKCYPHTYGQQAALENCKRTLARLKREGAPPEVIDAWERRVAERTRLAEAEARRKR